MDSKIKVALRCRPFLANESNKRRVLNFSTDAVGIGDKKYQFEQVFDEKSSQSDVYEFCVKSLVDGCFEGYNGTVFAYGQTGSGKTHSIMGSMAGIGDDVEAGIIPRAVRQVFDTLHTANAGGITRMATIRVSMIELYNDECKDLLHPEIPSRDIMIREDKHGRIFFTGAREEVVTDAESALQYLELGNINRSTAETLMNQASSRSHAIFTISLEILEYSKNENEEEENSFIHAKLHLVDLAGSERAKKTGASGQRLKESVGINQGLLSLGKVIRALTTNPVTHVPYRESKLTRFLQDSLGGNSRTVLLACVSPSELSLNETINTIQYAQRAKAIHNKVVANVATGVASSELQNDLESSLVISLRAEIVRMQRELTTMNHAGIDGGIDDNDEQQPKATVALQDKIRQMEHKIHQHVQLFRSMRNTLQTAATTYGNMEINTAERIQGFQKANDKLLMLISEALLAEKGRSEAVSQMRRSLRESWNEIQHNSQNDSFENRAQSPTQSRCALEEELQAVREELEECREDLKRDEEIFAEKMKELKKAKKTIKDLESEKYSWQEKQKAMQQQLIKLSKLPKLFVADFNLEDTITSVVTPSKSQKLAGSPTSAEKEKEKEKSTLDDLDVSIAVALSEPDISQLMEDFEAVWKEKEDLMQNYKRIEENMQKIESVAHAQKEKIQNVQYSLQKKLRYKDAQLRERTRELLDAQEQNRRLREELQDLKYQRAKLLEDLASVQRGAFGEEDGKASESLALDEKVRRLSASIENMTEERNDLVLRLREMEGQISRMERTHAEDREDWQGKEAEYQHKIIILDEVCRNLKEDLSLAREEQSKLFSEKSSSGKSNKNKEGSNKNLKGKSPSSLLRMSHTEQLNGWLEESLEAIVKEGIAQIEVLRLQKQMDILQSDRDAAKKELDSLRCAAVSAAAATSTDVSSRPSTAAGMDAKILAIDEKIRTLKLKATNVRMKLLADPNQDSLKRELQDIEYNIDSYEEHKAEFEERLAAENAALLSKRNETAASSTSSKHPSSSSSSATMPITAQELELQDDIEALETEISALQTRLQQELKRTQVLQEQNYKRFDIAAESSNPSSSSNKPKKASFALDAIINNVIRELLTTFYDKDGEEDSNLDYLLTVLLKLHIKHRIKAGSNEGTWMEAKQQLESKCQEYDNLVKHMQKIRNDALKKQEQLRKESDEKIAYLIQQIRMFENKGDGTSQRSSARQSPTPFQHGESGSSVASAATAALPPPIPAVGKALSTGGGGSDTSNHGHHTPNNRLRSSQQKRSLSDLLMHHAEELGGTDGLNQEVLKRWISEKERREQLEKRNAELAREVRELKNHTS